MFNSAFFSEGVMRTVLPGCVNDGLNTLKNAVTTTWCSVAAVPPPDQNKCSPERGILVAVEGGDGYVIQHRALPCKLTPHPCWFFLRSLSRLSCAASVGKNAQIELLTAYLKAKGVAVESFDFPTRTETKLGTMLDSFLKNPTHILPPQVSAMLFSADRWQWEGMMKEKMTRGKTLVVGRYAHSGVAYATALGLDEAWCKSLDTGLPKPDVVIFLGTLLCSWCCVSLRF